MRPDGTTSTPTGGRRVRLGAAFVAVAVGALLLTGCGAEDEPAAPSPSTTAPTASSSGTAPGTTPGTKAPSGTSTTLGKTTGTAPTGTAKPPTTEADTEPNTDLEATEEAEDVTWDLNAVAFRGQDYTRVAYACTAGGQAGGSVWGTGTYTDDSSVCTAAVHAGLITFADGGRVVIEIRPGADHYVASDAHGVSSQEYPAWDGSYVFPGA